MEESNEFSQMIDTMAKKMVSFVPIYNKKLTKRDSKKKKFLHKLKQVIKFLKSDDYMFAPLVSSKASDHVVSSSTISTGIEKREPVVEEKNKDIFGKVKDYMKSDCHMYAPVVTHQPWLRSSIDDVNPATDGKRESVNNVAEETRDIGNTIKSIRIGDQHVDGFPYRRHTVLQQETVKHVIKQSFLSSSAKGDMRKEKNTRKGPELDGRITRNTKKKRVA